LIDEYRFMEAVQGKELERIFKEEGMLDEEDDDSELFDDSEEPLNSMQSGQKGIEKNKSVSKMLKAKRS
jgi:hypothetical protein